MKEVFEIQLTQEEYYNLLELQGYLSKHDIPEKYMKTLKAVTNKYKEELTNSYKRL